MEYRDDVYSKLAEIYDVTVAFYDYNKIENPNYNTLKLTPIFLGPFVVIKESLNKLTSKFDSCLVMGDMHVLSYMFLGFQIRRKYSLTFWGGDVSFSYKKRYDEDRKFDKLRFYLMNKADSLVFYCEYPINRYVNDGGINKDKLFVANNTVYVNEKISIPKIKNYFLFVGTLYVEKKIFDLLEAYKIAFSKNSSIQQLYIIGTGDQKELISSWIRENGLEQKVVLLGAIYDSNILKRYFENAIACVSPGQAGLSVLTSLAYGVPFVTSKNAITGGEIFNIIDNYNGILYNGDIYTLSEILLELSSDMNKVFELSTNAQNYYFEKATLDNMVNGLIQSVDYALATRLPGN